MLNFIRKSAEVIVGSTKGNPVLSSLLVILFYFMFYTLESTIETLLFGARTEHWLDPVFLSAFIVFAGYTVYVCDQINKLEKRPSAVRRRQSSR